VPEEAVCAPTGSDALGPFYRANAPNRTELAGPEEPGDRLEIIGRVFGSDCNTPLEGAVLDIWNADASGQYDNASIDFRLRGVLMSDREGRYAFSTVRPGNYPNAGGMRPAHVHFTVSRPGYIPLTTQLYFSGDPYLGKNDSCGGCNSEDPTLVIELRPEEKNGKTIFHGCFNVVLQSN
jgi:catechol 1,2-dioxygenase